MGRQRKTCNTAGVPFTQMELDALEAERVRNKARTLKRKVCWRHLAVSGTHTNTHSTRQSSLASALSQLNLRRSRSRR